MSYVPVIEEYVPLLRQVLAASENADLRDVGTRGKLEVLVKDEITVRSIELIDQSILAAGPEHVASKLLQTQREALFPFVGKQLLRGGLWLSGRYYGLYIDPITKAIVHVSRTESSDPEGTENESMKVWWPHTILKDREPYEWIEANLFPKAVLQPVAWEAARVLYQCELQEPLLEFVVFGRPNPAQFSQVQLNAAIQDACGKAGYELDAYWWSVNLHDGDIRVVERVGTYSFRDPLIPLFTQLVYNPPVEGGPSYAGLLDLSRRWALSLENGSAFVISIHGPADFCENVAQALGQVPRSH